MAHFVVARTRARIRPEFKSLTQRLAAAISLRPGSAWFALEGVSVPHFGFVTDGQLFVLGLLEAGELWAEPREFHTRLRRAGARVEVAHTLPEALALMREAGVHLAARENYFGRTG